MKKSLLALTLASVAIPALAQEEVNVYSYRQAELIKPMLDEFTKETGIKVNILFADKGLFERIKSEDKQSPADVLLTVDISRVKELVEGGFAQPVQSKTLEKNIPAQFRDDKNEWFGLTSRARVIYTSKDRVGKLSAGFDYLDLAKPEYKGKVCVRSGKNSYNVSLFASMIAHYGEAKTKTFLEGLKANLAKKPEGGDRDQVKAIQDGICDYALGNSYYYGKMLENEKQKSWAESAYINFPSGKFGTHVNISAAAVAKYAPHKANAVKLVEFLSGNNAQKLYATLNHEYPVKAGVEPSDLVKGWGSFTADTLKLDDVAKHYEAALKLVDEVQFDKWDK